MSNIERHFLVPKNRAHRQYEALRAHFVDKLPIKEAAERFGYARGSLANLKTNFLKDPDRPFFMDGWRPKPDPEAGPDRNKRIIELRKRKKLTAIPARF